MLEKPCAQNITIFENQGTQCELSDHWKSKNIENIVFEKKSLQKVSLRNVIQNHWLSDVIIQRNKLFIFRDLLKIKT